MPRALRARGARNWTATRRGNLLFLRSPNAFLKFKRLFFVEANMEKEKKFQTIWGFACFNSTSWRKCRSAIRPLQFVEARSPRQKPHDGNNCGLLQFEERGLEEAGLQMRSNLRPSSDLRPSCGAVCNTCVTGSRLENRFLFKEGLRGEKQLGA